MKQYFPKNNIIVQAETETLKTNKQTNLCSFNIVGVYSTDGSRKRHRERRAGSWWRSSSWTPGSRASTPWKCRRRSTGENICTELCTDVISNDQSKDNYKDNNVTISYVEKALEQEAGKMNVQVDMMKTRNQEDDTSKVQEEQLPMATSDKSCHEVAYWAQDFVIAGEMQLHSMARECTNMEVEFETKELLEQLGPGHSSQETDWIVKDNPGKANYILNLTSFSPGPPENANLVQHDRPGGQVAAQGAEPGGEDQVRVQAQDGGAHELHRYGAAHARDQGAVQQHGGEAGELLLRRDLGGEAAEQVQGAEHVQPGPQGGGLPASVHGVCQSQGGVAVGQEEGADIAGEHAGVEQL